MEMANGPRERLLEATRRLSYQHGVHIGLDALLKEASVARRSLYQHFGSKDALIAEVMTESAAEDLQRYRDALDAGGSDPYERLSSLLRALEAVVSSPTFNGCRYTTAEVALDDDHPAHLVIHDYMSHLRNLFLQEFRQMNHPAPGPAADALLVLINGVLATATMRPSKQLIPIARQLVDFIIGDHPTLS